MAIDAGDLKGDFGIELDAEHVAAGDFVRAIEAFISLVREITRQINDKLPRDAWRLRVQEGSQVVALIPDASRLPLAVAEDVFGTVAHGIEMLERQPKVPPLFTERALENARELSQIASKRDVVIPLRVLSRARKTAKPVTKNTFNHVSEILDWKYEDLGTVDGTLQVVSAHDGYEIRIYEPIWLRPVRCTFDGEELLAEALRAFKKRVEVQGLIRYTRDGAPVSAKVLKISLFPDQSELPSYKDVKGILGQQNAP